MYLIYPNIIIDISYTGTAQKPELTTFKPVQKQSVVESDDISYLSSHKKVDEGVNLNVENFNELLPL